MNRRFIYQLTAEQRATKLIPLFNRYNSSSSTASKCIGNRLYYSSNGLNASSKRLVLLNRTLMNDKSILPPLYFGTSLFHNQTSVLRKDPESNAEKMSNLLKENIIKANESEEKKITAAATTQKPAETTETKVTDEHLAVDDGKSKEVAQPAKPRLTLWQKIVNECKHYYHGFKLLYFETKIAWRLFKQVLNGHTLTRRERKQFTRTSADLFRLVPFSVFIIVPFMEFTLPIFLKLFPNMLPSTFKEQDKEQDKLKKRLKAKLEMAKFLQDTLEETALKGTDGKSDESLNHKFAEFMKKIRTKGEQPSSEDILKYSALFENELTLDNLNRQQLIALCQILDVSTLANIPPNHILRFQLRMKLRSLEADDKMIIKEGVDSLDTEELQQACRERGMRALGVSEYRLRKQLEQWLDLHINRKIPISLLMLSRAMYLPENLAPEDLIKTTISALPKSIETATIAKITEAAGGQVNNEVKLELLKQEEAEIRMEKAAKVAESPVPAAKPTVAVTSELGIEKDLSSAALRAKEQLIDKAKVIAEGQEVITPTEIKEINQIIENLPISEEKQVKAEIDELKKDLTEYKEDIKEVEEMTNATKSKLTEAKSAKNLGKRVQKLLTDMDKLLGKLEKESNTAPSIEESSKNTVSIDELLSTIKKIRGVSNDVKEQKLKEVLATLDKDHDGKIDDLNDVLKVFDLIEQENVKVTKDQLGKILTLLEKEKQIEKEEEQQQQQQQQQQASKSAGSNNQTK